MALFPECTFEVLLSGGVFVPGERARGTLKVTAKETIPRTDHLELEFRTRAWAGYGSGKSRAMVRRDVLTVPFRVDLPKELAAGVHRFPFEFDVPEWLPPGFRGQDCAIEHTITSHLEVHWAKDPHQVTHCLVVPPPVEGAPKSLATRSPLGFHKELSLEVTLASTVIVLGEPIVGRVALRSGHAARFDGIDLTFGSVGKITMARGDARLSNYRSKLRITADALRGGMAVPFTLAPHEGLVPSFKSSFIDHEAVLQVRAAVPWLHDPVFDIPLRILPRGSTIAGEASAGEVGNERLSRLAALMAKEIGLRPGPTPTLLSGAIGPVVLCVTDAPRGADLGLGVDLTYPDVELGITLRKLTVLEGFRASPLAPDAVAKKYLLRCKTEDAALRPFFDALLDDVEIAEEVRCSDHHLGFRLRLADDDPERMVKLAQILRRRAEAIAEAIGALSFPAAAQEARAAWSAVADEQEAFLVPTGPALHGLSFRARVIGGEERVLKAVIRTEWRTTDAVHHVDVDLADAPLPATVCAALVDDDAQACGPYWSSADALGDGHGATLTWHGFAPDPRVLLPAIEHFIGWVLETRGERRADLPYR
jgi:hypothetical protein